MTSGIKNVLELTKLINVNVLLYNEKIVSSDILNIFPNIQQFESYTNIIFSSCMDLVWIVIISAYSTVFYFE